MTLTKKQTLQSVDFANYLICNLSKYIKTLTINNYKNNFNLLLADNADILKVITFFKKHTQCQFLVLSDIFGIDMLVKDKRFRVAYNLLSIRFNCRVRLSVLLNESERVPTITHIYNSASWLEREVWDMFGIYFNGNTDLRRILTDYGFEGFPLRKDFPLSGFIEVRYDDSFKRIVYEPLEITQEFRFFDFKSPWEQIKNLY